MKRNSASMDPMVNASIAFLANKNQLTCLSMNISSQKKLTVPTLPLNSALIAYRKST